MIKFFKIIIIFILFPTITISQTNMKIYNIGWLIKFVIEPRIEDISEHYTSFYEIKDSIIIKKIFENIHKQQIFTNPDKITNYRTICIISNRENQDTIVFNRSFNTFLLNGNCVQFNWELFEQICTVLSYQDLLAINYYKYRRFYE